MESEHKMELQQELKTTVEISLAIQTEGEMKVRNKRL